MSGTTKAPNSERLGAGVLNLVESPQDESKVRHIILEIVQGSADTTTRWSDLRPCQHRPRFDRARATG